mgnify:CR=1 FL=1
MRLILDSDERTIKFVIETSIIPSIVLVRFMFIINFACYVTLYLEQENFIQVKDICEV